MRRRRRLTEAIYSFTGASACYLENFTTEFKNARLVRSSAAITVPPRIVELANCVIEPDRSTASVKLVSALNSGRPVSTPCIPTTPMKRPTSSARSLAS